MARQAVLEDGFGLHQGEGVRDGGLAAASFTCALAGPWQPSQPVRSGGSLPEAMLLKCGFLKKFCQMSAWQVRQALLPTYPAAGRGRSRLGLGGTARNQQKQQQNTGKSRS